MHAITVGANPAGIVTDPPCNSAVPLFPGFSVYCELKINGVAVPVPLLLDSHINAAPPPVTEIVPGVPCSVSDANDNAGTPATLAVELFIARIAAVPVDVIESLSVNVPVTMAMLPAACTGLALPLLKSLIVIDGASITKFPGEVIGVPDVITNGEVELTISYPVYPPPGDELHAVTIGATPVLIDTEAPCNNTVPLLPGLNVYCEVTVKGPFVDELLYISIEPVVPPVTRITPDVPASVNPVVEFDPCIVMVALFPVEAIVELFVNRGVVIVIFPVAPTPLFSVSEVGAVRLTTPPPPEPVAPTTLSVSVPADDNVILPAAPVPELTVSTVLREVPSGTLNARVEVAPEDTPLTSIEEPDTNVTVG